MGKYAFSEAQDKRREERRPKMKAKNIKKIKMPSIPKLLAMAQEKVNRYVRERDNGLPCISCGQHRELQAGHYVPQRNSSFLRFDENNIHGECGGCNCFDEFHLIGYRKRLIDKIGLDAVKYLEEHAREKKKWTRDELYEIITRYSEKRA